MKKWWLLLIGLIMVTGCISKEAPPAKPKPPKEEISIEEYYPQENKTYQYRGEGNEYAAYTEVFYKKTDSYLPSIVDNGGTRLLRIYQLTEKGIYVVYEQPEFYNETIPSFDEMKQYFNPVPLLEKPIKENTSFNGWKIINTNEKMMLFDGEVKNIIIIEQHDQQNNTVVRKYWAPKLGMVKQEFESGEENPEKFSVMSELVNIK